jgi:hypothetical protein
MTGDLPLIYVASPLSDPTAEGVAHNIAFAETICRMVSLSGGAPYAPHLLLPRFLDDKIPEERGMGINAGLRMLSHCDELWAVLPPWRVSLSVGMQQEVLAARNRHIPIHICMHPEEVELHLDRLKNGEILRSLR